MHQKISILLLTTCFSAFAAATSCHENFPEYFDSVKQDADKGIAEAQFALANLYIQTDLKEHAFNYYKLAADQGHAVAQYNVALLYNTGEGVKTDHAQAFYYYTLAASQKNPHAQFNLGLMHYIGEHVPKDLKKAFDLFSLSADQGYEKAHFNLATMYHKGEHVWKDPIIAFTHFKISADKGNIGAQYNVGVILEERGHPERALHYYKLAAHGGFEDAKVAVAIMHLNSMGTAENAIKAAFYLERLSRQGNARAKEAIDERLRRLAAEAFGQRRS